MKTYRSSSNTNAKVESLHEEKVKPTRNLTIDDVKRKYLHNNNLYGIRRFPNNEGNIDKKKEYTTDKERNITKNPDSEIENTKDRLYNRHIVSKEIHFQGTEPSKGYKNETKHIEPSSLHLNNPVSHGDHKSNSAVHGEEDFFRIPHKFEKDTNLADRVTTNIYKNKKVEYTDAKVVTEHHNDNASIKRKFDTLDKSKFNKYVNVGIYESMHNGSKKNISRQQSSTNINFSDNSESKENQSSQSVSSEGSSRRSRRNKKMRKYDFYKNNISNGEYMNNLNATGVNNMHFRGDQRKNEEENNKEKSLPYGTIQYKENSNTQENLFKGNIRYNSATTSEFPKNNTNQMEMNNLYINDMNKLNMNLGAFNEANKLSELQEKYKNNFMMDKEGYKLKNEVPFPITGTGLYNETNATKNDLRSNYMNNLMNEEARKETFGNTATLNNAEKEIGKYNRMNYKANSSNSIEIPPVRNLEDITNKKKKLLNDLMNMHKNEEEKVSSGFNITELKNKYLDNYYNRNYMKPGVELEYNNNKGAHRRSSSSNIHLGKNDKAKTTNCMDDTEAKLNYLREKEPATVNAQGGGGYDKYTAYKNEKSELFFRNHYNEMNLNSLKNRNEFPGDLTSNAMNSAKMNMHIRGDTPGNPEYGNVSDLEMNDLRKKNFSILNSNLMNNENIMGVANPASNHPINPNKEENDKNKIDEYMNDKEDMYNLTMMNEKNKMQPLMNNYEDLLSFDKNLRKKMDAKSIVCVCQASKQMARLQVHIEESRQMLETEKNLLKKRKENFEKKMEMLAEKEKEIEKMHLQTKEKDMHVEKKKNEIEEKEKYVNAIKNKYDNAQKELLEKMNECITIENKCKSKLYEYDEKFGQFNKKIKEMEEREREIEQERKQIERKEKLLNSTQQELEQEKMVLLKEKAELETFKKEMESSEKETKKRIENEYNHLQNKEEEIRRNERNNIMKEKELESRIDRYNGLIDELNKNKKEFEKDKKKLVDEMQEERMKLMNERKQLQMELEHEKKVLKKDTEHEKNYMKEEIKKDRIKMIEDMDRMKANMLEDIENTKQIMLENVSKEKIKMQEKLEEERNTMKKNLEDEKEKLNTENDKFKNMIEERYKESYENDKYRLEKRFTEEENRLKTEYENKMMDLKNELDNEKSKLNQSREHFEQQKKMYEEDFRNKCDSYEENIQKKYKQLEEDRNKMKYLVMKEQEELENYKKQVYMDIEEEKEKLYVQQEKINLEKENLMVEKEQIEIELKNYKNFKEKEENDIKIRIINLSQQQEDLNKEKENVEKEKEELEKRRLALDEKEECLNNDKCQIEESRKIFDEQLEKIKKNKEELLNYDKELKKREISLIEREKEQNKQEEEMNKKKESLTKWDSELKEYSERLQGREKKLKEKKNELQKVKDQLVNYKNSIKQKEAQFQNLESREKELLDEQTLIQIDRNSLEAEKKQFFLLKEKQEKDTDFIQEQLKLLHEQLKNKEKSLKEKENEVSLLSKLQDCRNKSGKGTIISLQKTDNRMSSTNVGRASIMPSKVKDKVIGKNRLDIIKKRNRKKSINFNYNNLDINNSIQYIDSMINENFKNRPNLKYQNDHLELSDANYSTDRNTRVIPPRSSILMNNEVNRELLNEKIAGLMGEPKEEEKRKNLNPSEYRKDENRNDPRDNRMHEDKDGRVPFDIIVSKETPRNGSIHEKNQYDNNSYSQNHNIGKKGPPIRRDGTMKKNNFIEGMMDKKRGGQRGGRENTSEIMNMYTYENETEYDQRNFTGSDHIQPNNNKDAREIKENDSGYIDKKFLTNENRSEMENNFHGRERGNVSAEESSGANNENYKNNNNQKKNGHSDSDPPYHNNYDMNNANTNIKMGTSNFTDGLNSNMGDRMDLNIQGGGRENVHNPMWSLNVNHLIESDLHNTGENYFSKPANEVDHGSTEGMKIESGSEKREGYIEEGTKNGEEFSMDQMKKRGVGANRNKNNALRGEKISVSSETKGKTNADPLHAIDNLVNKNMQSINQMSSLMMSTKPRGTGTLGGQTDIPNNRKHLPLKNLKKPISEKLYGQENEPMIKKDDCSNEMDDMNSENYYNPSKGNTKEKNDAFFYNMEKTYSKNFTDSSEYKDNYEIELKREEGTNQMYDNGDKTDQFSNRLNNKNNYNNNYNNDNTKRLHYMNSNIKMMQDSGYNSDSNIVSNQSAIIDDTSYKNMSSQIKNNYGQEKRNGIQRVGVTNATQSDKLEENFNKDPINNNNNNNNNNYNNEYTDSNYETYNKNVNPVQAANNKNSNFMNDKNSGRRNEKDQYYEDRDNSSIGDETNNYNNNNNNNRNRNQGVTNNQQMNTMKSMQMNNARINNQEKAYGDLNELNNLNRKLQNRALPNMNKNTNIRMKGRVPSGSGNSTGSYPLNTMEGNGQMKNMKGRINYKYDENVANYNRNYTIMKDPLNNANKGGGNNNTILEELDKTLLNKSIMMTNKNKKNVSGRTNTMNPNMTNENVQVNMSKNENANMKGHNFYSSLNSDLIGKNMETQKKELNVEITDKTPINKIDVSNEI